MNEFDARLYAEVVYRSSGDDHLGLSMFDSIMRRVELERLAEEESREIGEAVAEGVSCSDKGRRI